MLSALLIVLLDSLTGVELPCPLQQQRVPCRSTQGPDSVHALADLTEGLRGERIDLARSVPLEAQVGALYMLYCLYCTQPFAAVTRIYLSPFHLAALHKLLKVRTGPWLRELAVKQYLVCGMHAWAVRIACTATTTRPKRDKSCGARACWEWPECVAAFTQDCYVLPLCPHEEPARLRTGFACSQSAAMHPYPLQCITYSVVRPSSATVGRRDRCTLLTAQG